MKTVNKSAMTLILTMILLAAGAVVFIEKLSHFLRHTFYYCESMMRSISWQVPKQLFFLAFAAAITLVAIAIAKIIFISLYGYNLKKSVSKRTALYNTIDNPKPQAFCFGILSPKIYVSSGLLDMVTKKELEIIIRHEAYHLQHKDNLIMLIIYTIQHFFPFFPLLKDLITNYRIERELKADAAAIQAVGESKPLVTVLQKLLRHDHYSFAFAPALADEDTLEARIQALINKNHNFRNYKTKNIIISIASVAALSSIFFIPVNASAPQEKTDNAMMRCYYSNDQHFSPARNKSVPYTPAQ